MYIGYIGHWHNNTPSSVCAAADLTPMTLLSLLLESLFPKVIINSWSVAIAVAIISFMTRPFILPFPVALNYEMRHVGICTG